MPKISIFLADLDRESPYSSLPFPSVSKDKNLFLHQKRKSHSQQLLLGILSSLINIPIKKLELGQNEHGKPFLITHRLIEFNLSHSENLWVLAINQEGIPLGIDIETQKPDKNFHKISSRFFSQEENYFLNKLTDPSLLTKAFFKIWTMKEAYIKCLGKGLSLPLNSFSVIESFDVNKFENENYTIKITNFKNEIILQNLELSQFINLKGSIFETPTKPYNISLAYSSLDSIKKNTLPSNSEKIAFHFEKINLI